jgi:DNA adenine methylase
MPTTMTPLRYPGGKTKFYPHVKEILKCNGLLGQTYVEPFAGGAGLAIKLLLNEDVNRIVINDLDPSIFAFWHSVLDCSQEFCALIEKIKITPEEWRRQRAIYQKQDVTNLLELGFATFFLNRTCVSGVITGGIIGGVHQSGSNLIDARFNKSGLISKIRAIAKRKEQIHLFHLDAQELLQPQYIGRYYKTLINFDPPYVKKGAKLYKNSFNEENHKVLSGIIASCKRKWIVTYDVCPLISELYSKYRHGFLDITYSVNSPKKAKEFIFYSDNLIIPKGTGYYEVEGEARLA